MISSLRDRENEQLAFIGLGSNLGEREMYLQQAIKLLESERSIEVDQCSSIYETDPVGYLDQSPFLNMVISVYTGLFPRQLLSLMLGIEQKLGRTRDIPWGPRTIDLDLLLYDHTHITATELIIPHPRMMERPFVLIPLAEIVNHRQNAMSESILKQLEKLDGKDGVRLWKKMHWPSGSEPFAN